MVRRKKKKNFSPRASIILQNVVLDLSPWASPRSSHCVTAEGAARKASSPSPSGKEPRLHGQREQRAAPQTRHITRLTLSVSQAAEFPAGHQGAGKNPTDSALMETSPSCPCTLHYPNLGMAPIPTILGSSRGFCDAQRRHWDPRFPVPQPP